MKLQKVCGYNLTNQMNIPNKTSVPQSSVQAPIQDEVSFSGAPDIKAVSQTMENVMPSALTGMKKAKDSMGEVQNILINAIGTGCVAPVFIKWNPLSKTDKDTRTYSAWRQPVSAILTIATQVAITIPFNNAIKDMAKTGAFGQKFNETPYATKEAEAALLNSLRNENTIYYNTSKFDGAAKPKEIDAERYKSILTETLNSLRKKEDEELARYEGTKKTLRITRSKYYQANPDKAKETLDSIEQIVTSGKDAKTIQSELSNKIKEMKANKVDSELIKMAEEIDERGAILKENLFSKFLNLFRSNKKQADNKAIADVVVEQMQEKVKKMKGHIEIYKNLTPTEAEQHAASSIESSVREIKHAQTFLDDALKKLKNGATVTDIERLFSIESQNNKSFRLADKKFAEEVVKKLKTLTQNNISIFKQISGLIVSCAMLPVTCELLNRLYPVFMDAVFPNLSSKKHSNVSSNLVDKATKNSEVK